MVNRKLRRLRQEAHKLAEKRYERHRRQNLVQATPGVHEFIIVLDNLKPSFNIGKIFRSADAFGARGVHLIGTEFFDPASAMGSFKWVPAFFYNTFAECYEHLVSRKYTLFTLEPEEGELLNRVELPKRSAFIYGHEEFGFSFDKRDFNHIQSLRIEQQGRVQSLNVSVAASIVMYEYFRQHNQIPSVIDQNP